MAEKAWQPSLDLAVMSFFGVFPCFFSYFSYNHWEVVVMMKLTYLCRSWQSFLENLVDLIGHGYYYVCVNPLPRRKEQRFLEIDFKIMHSYQAFYNKLQSKDKYYRRKKKGLANFRYLRWDNIAVVLHTPGMIICNDEHYVLNTTKRKKSKDRKFLTVNQAKQQQQGLKYYAENYTIEYTEKFQDVRYSPVTLQISDNLHLEIRLMDKVRMEGGKKRVRKQVTIRMTKDMYSAKLVELLESVEQKAYNRLIYQWEMLNNLPNWAGIIEQKKRMKQVILNHAKKHHFKLKPDKFEITTFRKKQEDKFVSVICDFDKQKIILNPIEIVEDNTIDEGSVFE